MHQSIGKLAPVIQALGRLKQEDYHELTANPATERDVSTRNKPNKSITK